MCALVLSDSHGKGLKAVFEEIRPAWDVMGVAYGRKTQELLLHYEERKGQIEQFRPDVIVLHSGHNDVAAHPGTIPILPVQGSYYQS
jgi:hypothetical protein